MPSLDSEHWVLLRTDAHHDNPHARWDLETKHLDQAVERNAGIIDAGDVFCCMQGKYDKRADKSCLRPEHQCSSYFDALVRTAADFYEPYADRWVTIGHGNHESEMRKKHETDLIERLCATLTDRTGHPVQAGGYTVWVRYQLNYGTATTTVNLWYAHGWGGGGPVTLGTIQAAIRGMLRQYESCNQCANLPDWWAPLSMIAVKLNRIASGRYHADNFADLRVYLDMVEQMQKGSI